MFCLFQCCLQQSKFNVIMPHSLTRRARLQNEQNKRRIIAVYFLLTLQYLERDFWVHPINENQYIKGEFYTLYQELWQYPEKIFRWYRITMEQFDFLLGKLKQGLQKQNNNYSNSISAEERLVITLR